MKKKKKKVYIVKRQKSRGKRVAIDGNKVSSNKTLLSHRKHRRKPSQIPLLSHIPNLSLHQNPIPKPYSRCMQKKKKSEATEPEPNPYLKRTRLAELLERNHKSSKLGSSERERERERDGSGDGIDLMAHGAERRT